MAGAAEQGSQVTFERGGVTAFRAEQGVAAEVRVGVVVARFNSLYTQPLFAGAVDVLRAGGVQVDRIRGVQVPGAVEIPVAVRELVAAGCDGVVALGCVLRGETAHFDYVCRAVTDGCLRVMLDERVPVGLGVIMADTAEQAERRSAEARESGGGHNVGADAAHAVLEMLGVVSALRR